MRSSFSGSLGSSLALVIHSSNLLGSIFPSGSITSCKGSNFESFRGHHWSTGGDKICPSIPLAHPTLANNLPLVNSVR